MITLRPDQLDAVGRLREALKQHQSALLQAPCGFGKTVVAAYIAAGAHARRKRVIFAVHRRELARQTALTFERFGIPFGWIMAGEPSNPFAHVHVASADTLRNKIHMLKCDLFVADEAHLWGDGTRADLIDHARAMGGRIIPLTATPARGDGKPMSRIADVIVPGPSVRSLINQGSLADYKVFAPTRPDLSGLHVRAGEYIASEVDEAMQGVVADAVRYYRELADGKRMIGYAPSRMRGEEYAEEFRSAGVSAAFIDGETPDADRRRVIAAFADGAVKVLFNCALFREGFDLSAQVGRDVPIQAVGLYNPTRSLPLAVQMMMRGMRPQDGRSIILDHAGITVNHAGMINHGFPDDEREWSLDGKVKSGNAEATIPSVTCGECGGVFRPVPTCPYCGWQRPIMSRVIDEIDDAVLGEVDPGQARLQADLERRRKEFARGEQKAEERKCQSLADWEALARKRGHKRGWAMHMWNVKGRRMATA